MKGKLIVIEGTDSSGKGTQLDLLVKRLEENDVRYKTFDFPRYDSEHGKKVGEYLDSDPKNPNQRDPYDISKEYAEDRLEVKLDIEKWLDEGYFVLCNRYVESNKGHQGARIQDEEERRKYLEWIDDLEYNINGMPRADLMVFLYLPYELGQLIIESKPKREYTDKKKDLHEGDPEHLKKAEQTYLELAKKEGWYKVDCAKLGWTVRKDDIHKEEYIHEMVWKEVKKLI
ncbi:thymidylate kinase [Candidatus Woesearchaeota archaeon]|nr:thymidylate kinase [Candidatus Woesearchaeota archaeon]